MIIRAALIWFSLLNATLALAQPVRLTPTWERRIDTFSNIQHHASADLISIQVGDSLTFFDVWTGDSITTRLNQGDFCFVDSTRTVVQWTHAEGEYFRSYVGSFTEDTIVDTIARSLELLEHNPYQWRALSSSAANMSFMYEWGGIYHHSDDEDQGGAFLCAPLDSSFRPGWFNTAHGPNTTLSRSGFGCGGVDSGRRIQNPWSNQWKILSTWDRIRYAGLMDTRWIELKKQSFAWLNDIDNILIASSGLYSLKTRIPAYYTDSAVFLRPLPQGWHWHAPFADWTYALACKSDSSQVSIVSLVTDSVVAQCTPTSGHIDTIYSDVQRNYIITYDAAARVLSGFVVDEALIPGQVISSIADGHTSDDDDGHNSIPRLQGAQDIGLLWPNPASDVAHIRVPAGAEYITITSALGMFCAFAVTPGTEVVDVPLYDFSNGVYVVHIGAEISKLLYILR